MQTVLNAGAGPVEAHYAVSAVEAADGRARAQAAIGPWARTHDGRFAPGFLGPLIDMAWSHAVLSRRLDGQWGVSTEIGIDMVSEPALSGRLTATGDLLMVDSAGGVAAGEVRDETGRQIAVGTLWSSFINVPAPNPSRTEAEGIDEVGRRQRPRCFEDLVGLHKLGEALELPQSPLMTNPLGVGHGGALFAAASLAAIRVVGRPETQIESLRGFYERPAKGAVALTAEVMHPGRRFTTVQVTAKGADGCTAARFNAAMRIRR